MSKERNKIVIIAFGSTGDIFPYAALALGLQAAGFRVRVVTHKRFAPMLTARGLEAWGVDSDSKEMLGSEAGQGWLKSGTSPLKFGLRLAAILEPLWHQMAQDCLVACNEADMIIASSLAVYVAAHVAEKLEVPFIPAFPQPLTPTRVFGSPIFPNWMGQLPFLNRLSHRLYWRGSWAIFRRSVNRMRRESLNLPELPVLKPYSNILRHARAILYAHSPSVLPKPPDWTAFEQVCGYWFLPPVPGWSPSPELQQFLEAGPPPVCVGFGSMFDQDAGFLANTVIEALKRNNLRGVLLTGWGGLGNVRLPDTVIKLESAPHDWLFPRMAAVVHHGGAGTTAAGLRAGLPTVIVPFFADQYFWGSVVHRLGAGVQPIPRKRLTADNLTRAVAQAVLDNNLRRRAQALGESIAREDGVKNAVTFLSQMLVRKG